MLFKWRVRACSFSIVRSIARSFARSSSFQVLIIYTHAHSVVVVNFSVVVDAVAVVVVVIFCVHFAFWRPHLFN